MEKDKKKKKKNKREKPKEIDEAALREQAKESELHQVKELTEN